MADQTAPPPAFEAKLRRALSHFFGDLDEKAFAVFLSLVKWVRLADGDLLVQQGDKGDSMYILIEGLLWAEYTDVKGQKKIVGEIKPGESVGEMALFTGENRTASIVAAQDSQLVQISQEGFDQLLLDYPIAIKNMANLVIHRLKELVQAELEFKLLESELLLKEVHHRVKNNLQVISSMLNLQSAHVDHPRVKEAVKSSQDRVNSMALIHQKLYQREDQASVEMCEYIQSLGNSLVKAYQVKGQQITFSVACPALKLDIDTAIYLGLIINELITNCLKYAFPDQRDGEIACKLEIDEKQYLVLEVGDNGVGKLEKSEIPSHSTQFGTKLIDLLRLQLGGTQEIDTREGRKVVIRMKNYEVVE